MHVLNKISNDERINLNKTLKNICSFKYTYVKGRKLFIICFNELYKKDFFNMFSKLIPFVYHEYSKHRLNNNGSDTTIFVTWPDLRQEHTDTDHRRFRNFKNPIFTGIRIPYNQSDNFIATYKSALLKLFKNDERELSPITFYLTPILTFENIYPAEYFNFTSFVEYYGEYWGSLEKLIKRSVPLSETDKYIGYLSQPGPLFDHPAIEFNSLEWGAFELDYLEGGYHNRQAEQEEEEHREIERLEHQAPRNDDLYTILFNHDEVYTERDRQVRQNTIQEEERVTETIPGNLTVYDFAGFWDDFHGFFRNGTFRILYSSLGIERIERIVNGEPDVPTKTINTKQTFKSDYCVLCLDEEKKPVVLFCNCGRVCVFVMNVIVYENLKCPVCKSLSDIKRKL